MTATVSQPGSIQYACIMLCGPPAEPASRIRGGKISNNPRLCCLGIRGKHMSTAWVGKRGGQNIINACDRSSGANTFN